MYIYICGPCSECIPILPILYVCMYVAVPADGECRRSSGHGGLRCGNKGQRVPAWGDGTRLHRSPLRDTGHGSHCVKGTLHAYILWLQYVCICTSVCMLAVCTRVRGCPSPTQQGCDMLHYVVHITVCTYTYVCMYVCMPPPAVLQ